MRGGKRQGAGRKPLSDEERQSRGLGPRVPRVPRDPSRIGMGRGGARVGAGRKPFTAEQKWLNKQQRKPRIQQRKRLRYLQMRAAFMMCKELNLLEEITL